MKYRIWDKKDKRYLDKDWLVNQDGLIVMDIGDVTYGSSLSKPQENDKNDCIIERSTGLNDKNGTEIYEGDLIDYLGWNHIVKFNNGIFYTVQPNGRETFISMINNSCKITGNIHNDNK